MADRAIHFELDPTSRKVACGMRKIGMMGLGGASHWLTNADIERRGDDKVTCTRCATVIINRRAKGLALTKGN